LLGWLGHERERDAEANEAQSEENVGEIHAGGEILTKTDER
jgi:hypothetical protein